MTFIKFRGNQTDFDYKIPYGKLRKCFQCNFCNNTLAKINQIIQNEWHFGNQQFEYIIMKLKNIHVKSFEIQYTLFT